MANIIKKYYLGVRRRMHRIRQHMRLKKECADVTLITQNCVGGVMYNILNLPFNSPTINLFITDENFVKLAENPEHYLTASPFPIDECYIDEIDSDIRYPVIGIDDIQICCLHYEDCKSAIDAWNRRRARVNYDKIMVVANVWNLHDNPDYIERLCKIPYPCIIFSDNKKFGGENIVQLPDEVGWQRDKRGIVRPDITDFSEDGIHRLFENCFDYVDWINKYCGRK